MIDFSQERKEAKVARKKTIPLPSRDEILVAPTSPTMMSMEYVVSVYPLGFGFSKEGNIAVFTNDYADSTDPIYLEHIITPKQLEKIIETAQDILDNLGRHTIGVKTK
jgi:hypothetical protein